jgi:hypothetical protein
MMRLGGLLAAAAVLAGCGLKGDLSTPPPLWGDRDRPVVERDLPGGAGQNSERIVFTRDDVDLFQDDEAEEDPFADPDSPAAPEDLPLGPESDE